ncbi:hypothetical protein [Arthrobacter sp. efr-133-TYG-104]|uniref:hypothetical protein n=1 Tax=Arthrobacter sp. efr-133-TYG-104 TaxID=3040324 RepID=UPI00254B7D6F|nr:hypothetical protein [Arthrobacter sp. efr-133-TYG-104]
MKGKVMFAVGVAVGYAWGSKSWSEVYGRVRGGTEKVLNNPDLQDGVHQAAEAVQESVPDILDSLYEAGKKLIDKAESMLPGSKGSESAGDSIATMKTVPAARAMPTVASDVVSEPGVEDAAGTDRAGESDSAP